MITKIKATIVFDTLATHPDTQNAKAMSFTDTYSFNSDMFDNTMDNMKNYIERDLRLIAGGGYNSKHISNVKISYQVLN